MAEENENLEGFEDLDGLLEDDAGGGGEDAGFGDELDNFLGEDDAGGGDAGTEAAGDEGGADSELDSFFEDLSTIDDLEVAQEEAPPAAEAAPAAEAPPAAAPAAAAAAAAAPAAAAAAAPAAPKQPMNLSGIKRAIKYLVLLAVLGGGGYFAYTILFPKIELPWPIVKEILEEDQPKPQPVARPELPPPPAPVMQPLPPPPPPPAAQPAAPPQVAAQPAPVPSAAPALPAGKGYGVQVATCFFATCVNGYKRLLSRTNRSRFITEKRTQSESLEILSATTFTSRDKAEELAGRINHEHRLEGQAYVTRVGGAYKVSMGTFPDLSRANVVKDSINQRLAGEASFTSRLKSSTYRLRRIVTGRFATRAEATREMRTLRRLDPRFRGSFVVRN